MSNKDNSFESEGRSNSEEDEIMSRRKFSKKSENMKDIIKIERKSLMLFSLQIN
jgi:hypothetical protein